MGSFLPLCHLEVEHLFFASGACRNLVFVPTLQTHLNLEKAGLLTQKTVNGIHVFYDGDRTESLRLYTSDPDQPFGLGFKIFSRDPAFQNYTEPALHQTDSLLYFDNRHVASNSSKRLKLHDGDTVSEMDYVPLQDPSLAEMLTFRDRLVRPICVVNIDVTAGEWPRNYYLKFRSRSTFWKYYLLGHMAREDVSITDSDQETTFVFAGEETLSDKRVAFTFRSTTPIPLRERANCNFQLKEKYSKRGKVLIMRLPVAAANQIHRDVIDGDDVAVSEMFIHG